MDLNLLVAFDALITERHVSRAAERINVSQPAMSRALRSLRDLFDDGLLLNTKEGMVPTPLALGLHSVVRDSLEQIAEALAHGVQTQPAKLQRRFVLAMTDIAVHIALRTMLRRLHCEAPNVDIAILNSGNRDTIAMVESGRAEIGVGVFSALPPSFDEISITRLDEVCLADPANPMLQGRDMDLDLFLSLPHVAVSVNGDHDTPLDRILETLGLTRRVAVTVPSFTVMPRLIVGSSMIGVGAKQLLNTLPERDELKVYPVPMPLTSVMAKIVWHRRSRSDFHHRWLRELMADTFCRAVVQEDIAHEAMAIV